VKTTSRTIKGPFRQDGDGLPKRKAVGIKNATKKKKKKDTPGREIMDKKETAKKGTSEGEGLPGRTPFGKKKTEGNSSFKMAPGEGKRVSQPARKSRDNR